MKLTAFLFVTLFSVIGFAADPPNTNATTEAEAKDKTVSTEWMKHMGPTENHKVLNQFAGNYKFTVKHWMTANSKPEESKGTSKGKWILGGRFVQQDVKGKAMGKDFNGMSLMGYDSLRGEYQSMWIDTMSNHMMTGTGSWDTASNTLSEKGTFSCAMTNDKNRVYRNEIKVTDPKNYTYTMFTNDKDGKEFKTMEITYTKM